MAKPVGEQSTLYYDLEGQPFHVGKRESTQSFKQNICRIEVSEYGTDKIEAFVRSKDLNSIPKLPGKIDWGYWAGRPLLYIKVTKELSETELNAIELAIREKGIKTSGGGLY